MKAPLCAGLLAAALAGCAVTPDYSEHDYQSNYNASLATRSTPGRAMAALPGPAGQVVSVLETRLQNSIVQDIVLAGEIPTYGQNKINISALTPRDPHSAASRDDMVKLDRPSAGDIEAEIDAAFPDVPMQISESYETNAQGSFGYAIGRRSGSGPSCLYAWQYIGPEAPIDWNRGLSDSGPYPISVRVRMCRSRMSEATLVGLVRQLVVTGPGYPTDAPVHPFNAVNAADALQAAGIAGGALYNRPDPADAFSKETADEAPVRGETRHVTYASGDEPRRHRHRIARHRHHAPADAAALDDWSARAPAAAVPLPDEVDAGAGKPQRTTYAPSAAAMTPEMRLRRATGGAIPTPN